MNFLKSYAVIGVILLSTAFVSCGNTQDSHQMQSRVDRALDDVDRDRDAVRSELEELRTDIDHKMLSIEEELVQADLSEDRRSDKEQQLLELEENRNRVQQALLELERADATSWNGVRQRSKKLTRSVDNWFERQAEKEDLRG